MYFGKSSHLQRWLTSFGDIGLTLETRGRVKNESSSNHESVIAMQFRIAPQLCIQTLTNTCDEEMVFSREVVTPREITGPSFVLGN
jgi:hypothetical protein